MKATKVESFLNWVHPLNSPFTLFILPMTYAKIRIWTSTNAKALTIETISASNVSITDTNRRMQEISMKIHWKLLKYFHTFHWLFWNCWNVWRKAAKKHTNIQRPTKLKSIRNKNRNPSAKNLSKKMHNSNENGNSFTLICTIFIFQNCAIKMIDVKLVDANRYEAKSMKIERNFVFNVVFFNQCVTAKS